jgi:hypothetical protein
MHELINRHAHDSALASAGFAFFALVLLLFVAVCCFFNMPWWNARPIRLYPEPKNNDTAPTVRLLPKDSAAPARDSIP